MILTDREIRIALDRGSISIDPRPSLESYSSTSVDLVLGNTIRTFEKQPRGIETVLNPSSKDYNFHEIVRHFTKNETISESGYILEPGRLILAWTSEKINLDHTSRIAARVEGKSSLARIGLAVHITAPTIHAGFKGQVQLEVINHGPLPIKLVSGMRICQLIFEQTLGVPDAGYKGQFLGQTT